MSLALRGSEALPQGTRDVIVEKEVSQSVISLHSGLKYCAVDDFSFTFLPFCKFPENAARSVESVLLDLFIILFRLNVDEGRKGYIIVI